VACVVLDEHASQHPAARSVWGKIGWIGEIAGIHECPSADAGRLDRVHDGAFRVPRALPIEADEEVILAGDVQIFLQLRAPPYGQITSGTTLLT
jgi:hypothetical protein